MVGEYVPTYNQNTLDELGNFHPDSMVVLILVSVLRISVCRLILISL